MIAPAAADLARRLRDAHHRGPVLVLPNAWDAASAVLLARAGADAIATTSNAIAASLGYPDGQRIPRDLMIEAIGRIARAVTVPVTADIEAGYGPTLDDVAATVTAVIEAGAVGINLEDAPGIDGPLIDVPTQTARLRAARTAAADAGLPDLVINARTDVFLRQVGDRSTRLEQTLARAAAYAEAGADCLFVPGLSDLDTLAAIVTATRLPVNALATPTGPTVGALAAIGIRRISVGPLLARTAYAAAAAAAAAELLTTGTCERCRAAHEVADLGRWIDQATCPPHTDPAG